MHTIEKVKITQADSIFGTVLKQMKDAPEELWIEGTKEARELLHRLPLYGLAVVGTREPQARSESQVKMRLREIASTQLIIISGLALGIDSCAHFAALELGLPTIAVLGCGLGMTYPKQNEKLRSEILASGGLVISEYEETAGAKPFHFIQRNRIIAGLSHAVWVVEAGFRSGALNTASWARKNERSCFATPCFPGDPKLAGNENLLKASQTRALWTSEDLSDCWLELHSVAHLTQPQPQSRAVKRPEDRLKERVATSTVQDGGATVQGLFDWAIGQGFQPLEFYDALQRSLASGGISEQNGVLAAQF